MGSSSSTLKPSKLAEGDKVDVKLGDVWVIGEFLGFRRGQKDPRMKFLEIEVIENLRPKSLFIYTGSEALDELVAPLGTHSGPKPTADSDGAPATAPAAPAASESALASPDPSPVPASFYEREFALDEEVDCLRFYTDKKTGKPMQCWEPCIVVHARRGAIKLRFLHRSKDDDMWLEMNDWPFQLAPAYSRSVDAQPCPRQPRADLREAHQSAASRAARLRDAAELGRQLVVAIAGGKELDISVNNYVDSFDVHSQMWYPAQIIRHHISSRSGTITSVQVLYENGYRDWISIKAGYLAELGSMVNKKCHDYAVGQFVDAMDIYPHKLTHETEYKWRIAEIMSTTDTSVFVHWLGWPSKFDIWINVSKEPHRIAPQGSKTEDTEESRRKKEQEQLFVTSMESAGLLIVDMDRDGNCMFRAVAHQIYGDPTRHMEVRNAVVDHMAAYREMFLLMCTSESQDFDSYLAKMRQEKQWGGYPEQIATEELFDRPIEIYSNVQFAEKGTIEPLHTHLAGELPDAVVGSVSPIRLSYHGNSHYNSVVSTSGMSPPLGETGTTYILDNRLARQARNAVLDVAARKHRMELLRSSEKESMRRLSLLPVDDEEAKVAPEAEGAAPPGTPGGLGPGADSASRDSGRAASALNAAGAGGRTRGDMGPLAGMGGSAHFSEVSSSSGGGLSRAASSASSTGYAGGYGPSASDGSGVGVSGFPATPPAPLVRRTSNSSATNSAARASALRRSRSRTSSIGGVDSPAAIARGVSSGSGVAGSPQ